MNNILYRMANAEDINDFIMLIKNGNEKYVDKIIYGCKGIDKFILENMRNNKSSLRYFIAESENKVIGAMEIKILNNNIFLNYIAIDKQYRSKKIGRNLIKYCVEHLINEYELKNIQLDVFEENIGAFKLYKKLGFQIINKYEWYTVKKIKNDDILVDYNILNQEEYEKTYIYRGFSNIRISMNEKIKNVGMLGEKWFRVTSNDLDNNLINCLSEIDDREILSIGDGILNISENDFNIDKLYNSYRMETSIERLIMNLSKE